MQKNRNRILCTLLYSAMLVACDLMEPVESTPEPSEYSYNYWLLQKTYLFEDELSNLPSKGDSVATLYKSLEDPYTRYIVPSKSEATQISINTSIIPGDVGMEYATKPSEKYPLFVYRVYEKSPAGRAGIPRYAQIIRVNGVEISGPNAYPTYDSILTYSRQIRLEYVFENDTSASNLEKETIYAPTIFLDTMDNVIFVSITEFKLTTVDQTYGSLGELKTYLDSTQTYSGVRVLDLRNNPGGHVSQCTAMADLFIQSGIISTRSYRAIDSKGSSYHGKYNYTAKSGDAGEKGKFILFVNRGTASCGEIFTAAVHEGAQIPVMGKTTYGKGIGQTTWKTKVGGLAIITNMDFLTPKGTSYHKKGIVPDYPCEGDANIQCALDIVGSNFKTSSLKKEAPLEEWVKNNPSFKPITKKSPSLGGAILVD
ncbi:MAG: peptidase S41 [Fibrobacteraceae bacterium]|nr:peptidase S41 [Fibrobacteraceae bacterium]